MKTTTILTILLAVLLAYTAGPARSVEVDAPHNASVAMTCTDCHSQFTAGTFTDDVCLSCHLNATGGGYAKNNAPKMLTHASANTGNKYGNWSYTCISCHNSHTQDQVYSGPASYLITGLITSVADNGDGTSTFGYANLVENYTGWSDYKRWGRKSGGNASSGNERGLILFANTSNLAVSFEILSATATSMTVKGSLNDAFPGAVAAGSPFAIAYGQLMSAGVMSAGSITRTVNFFQNSSVKSFAHADAPGSPDSSPDGICQVCHTRTSFWRYDGSLTNHYSGTNCTTCHKHEAGFKTSCDVCHSAPPSTGTHETHAGTATPKYYGSTAVQSTSSAYGYGCGICHQGTHLNTAADPRTVETVFSGVAIKDPNTQTGGTAAYTASTYSTDNPGKGYIFNYSDGTCSNTYCHGNYPGSGTKAPVTWTTGSALCGSCHGASNTTFPNSGTHSLHSANYTHNYSCTLCHRDVLNGTGPDAYTIADKSKHVNGYVDWMFDTSDPRVSASSAYSIPSGTAVPSNGMNPRVYGTCSNVYCHSIVQTSTGGPLTGAPGEYKTTEKWDRSSGTANCGECHKTSGSHGTGYTAALDSGSHTSHLSYAFNIPADGFAITFKCATCHRYESQQKGAYTSCPSCHSTGIVFRSHGDGKVDVTIDTAFGNATYNDTSPVPGTPGDGFYSCSNTYCHSNGTSVSTLIIPANTSPVWGSGTASCSACHGNPPSYPSGSPKANSHVGHAGETCDACHINTTTDGSTIASKTVHVNKQYNVAPDTVSGVTFTYTFAASGGSCSNISCHGGGTATWGTALTCQNCHLSTADVDDFSGFFYNNGAASKIKGAGEWDSTGHGRPAASGPYASGNTAAGFTTANACQYCHDSAVTHKTAANPFRLRTITDATWGMNGVCQNCHAEGSSGVTSDSVPKNGAKKIGATHYGTKHNAGANGGQLCWDCHDPHGDGNIFMVHAAVAKTSDMVTGAPLSTIATSFVTFATGTGYAKSTAPFNGICNVCHTSTSHYTATSGDGHNAGVNCSQCHNHTGGFKPGGDSCSDCHSAAGGSTPGTTPDAYHAKHVQTAYVGRISSGDYGNFTTNQWYRYSTIGGRPDTGCGYCHPQSAATHMNGAVNLNFNPNDAGAAGTLKAKNNPVQNYAQNQRVSVTCSSVYCHSNGYLNGGLYAFVQTPNWYGGLFTGDRCAACHGNSPTGSNAHAAHAVGIHYTNIFTGTTGTAAAGNTSTSSHGYADTNGTELTSTTLNCNICHNSTVTTAANDNNTLCATCHTGSHSKGAMSIAAGSTTHVNGQVEIVFTSVPIRSKAQVRDSIATVAELNNTWTRMNGYKGAGSYDVAKTAPNYSSGNCTVACHNSKPVSWGATLTCNSCHTDLP